MPVLCICLGFQLLNVVLGGTLDQHLADDPERLDHDRDMPRAEPVHHARLVPGSGLEDVFGAIDLPVNSHHHQGLDRLAAGLEPAAWAGDGVLEAVVAPGYSWVVGVQWHPEVMAPLDHRQLALFERFVAATRRYSAERSAA
jgi:putative glutamine amidotransferase